MERMNLSAVRLLNQHLQALYSLLHYISGTTFVTEHSFLSPIQSVSMGPTSFSRVTLLKTRHGCQCVLKTGTTITGDLCVNTWDTRGCHHHCLLVSDDLSAWYLDTKLTIQSRCGISGVHFHAFSLDDQQVAVCTYKIGPIFLLFFVLNVHCIWRHLPIKSF